MCSIRPALSWLLLQYSRVVYKLGVTSYRCGYFVMAGLFLRQHIRARGSSALLETANTNSCPNFADYESFEKSFRHFLEAKAATYERNGNSSIPCLRTLGPLPDIDRSIRARVLLVAPKYINSSERYIENDLWDHYFESLVNAGFDAQPFFGDHILYPYLMKLDPARAHEDLRELRRLVEEQRPEFLVFDANFVGSEGALSVPYLFDLKATYDVKFVAIISDGWGDYGRQMADYWAPVCDVIMHIAPGGAVEKNCPFQKKLWCSPIPVNAKNFHPDAERAFDVSFFGSYGTYLRAFWLSYVHLISNRLGLRSNLRGHNRTSDCPTITQYAAIMRKSQMVLNFSSRSPGVKTITGRVWQALNSGVLLLEEENDATRHFFVPFIHYVPFENARQLGLMIEFFKKNRDWTDRISRSARAICAERYSAEAIWTRVFDRVRSGQDAAGNVPPLAQNPSRS